MGTIFAQAGPDEPTQLIVLGTLTFLALMPTVFWIRQLVGCIKNERPVSSKTQVDVPDSRVRPNWCIRVQRRKAQ